MPPRKRAPEPTGVTRPTPARKRTGREKTTTAEEKGAQAARARMALAAKKERERAEHERRLEEDAEYATVNTREEALKAAKSSVTVTITGKMAQLYLGQRSVEDMDNEELARMQFRDKDGEFKGRRPGNLPAELVREMRQELIKRAGAMFEGSLLDSIDTLKGIATNDDVDPKDRIRAASLLIDRVLGKTPEKVEVSGGDKPFEVVFSKLARGPRRPDAGESPS